MRVRYLLHPALLVAHLATVWAGDPESSDFIIVGAGTAGCVLAAQLCTKLPESTFTLLERGPPRNEQADFLVRSPRQMWNSWSSNLVVESFPSVPDSGIDNRAPNIIAGKTLGGSSAINGMQWVVPVKGTVEKWRIKGLTTASSLKYYRQAFNKVGFKAQMGGLRQRYTADFIKAARLAGYPENSDPFDTRNTRDVFENRLAVDSKGRRVDSCTAYLTPVLNGTCKSNLKLLQGVTVTKIILSTKRRPGRVPLRRATGVQWVASRDKAMKSKHIVYAKKEVLIAAGPFGSPKLLQLSGIGPRQVLRNAGVRIKVKLPVGERTQARTFTAIDSSYATALEPSNNSTLLDSAASRKQWDDGDGGVLGIASFIANGRDRKDSYTTGTGSFFQALVDRKVMSANCNGNTKSFGYLRIKDANAFSAPQVDFALLRKQSDVDRSRRCLKRLTRVHSEFQKLTGGQFLNPSDGVITDKWIRENAGWAGHFVGGCAVGGVLRSDLRVRGVSRLRVVDSSSLRVIPVSAGPMASVYMLGEYMSEVISTLYK